MHLTGIHTDRQINSWLELMFDDYRLFSLHRELHSLIIYLCSVTVVGYRGNIDFRLRLSEQVYFEMSLKSTMQ